MQWEFSLFTDPIADMFNRVLTFFNTTPQHQTRLQNGDNVSSKPMCTEVVLIVCHILESYIPKANNLQSSTRENKLERDQDTPDN